jgi:hypothetical protein
MCALLVKQVEFARRALARTLTLQAASRDVGVFVEDAETMLPLAAALRSEAAAKDGPALRPRRSRRGQQARGEVAPALTVKSETSSLGPRAGQIGLTVAGGRHGSAQSCVAA